MNSRSASGPLILTCLGARTPKAQRPANPGVRCPAAERGRLLFARPPRSLRPSLGRPGQAEGGVGARHHTPPRGALPPRSGSGPKGRAGPTREGRTWGPRAAPPGCGPAAWDSADSHEPREKFGDFLHPRMRSGFGRTPGFRDSYLAAWE